jgi:hypothetical protein
MKVIKKRKVLSQAQEFRNGLKVSQELASLVSEGGMPTYTTRYKLLKNVIEYWKLGVEVQLLLLTERGDTTNRPTKTLVTFKLIPMKIFPSEFLVQQR